MDEAWWENSVCWFCKYWWFVLIILPILLGLAWFFWPIGDISVELIWFNKNDLDLEIVAPEGARVSYSRPHAFLSESFLIDANSNCIQNVTVEPVEQVNWDLKNFGRGIYQIEINFNQTCDTYSQTDFKVIVDSGKFPCECSGALLPGEVWRMEINYSEEQKWYEAVKCSCPGE